MHKTVIVVTPHLFLPPLPPTDSTLVGFALLTVEVTKSHSDTHTRQDSTGREIRPSQRALPDKTQQPQKTNIHDTGGIRTHNPSKRAAANSRFRYRGYLYKEKQKGNAYRQFQWHHTKLLLDAPLDLIMPRLTIIITVVSFFFRYL